MCLRTRYYANSCVHCYGYIILQTGRKEGREEGRKEGREEGRKEGRKKEQVSLIVKKIKKNKKVKIM